MITKSLADRAPAPSLGEEGEELCSLACLGTANGLQSLRGTADQGPGPRAPRLLCEPAFLLFIWGRGQGSALDAPAVTPLDSEPPFPTHLSSLGSINCRRLFWGAP